jgi:hypothetical protein
MPLCVDCRPRKQGAEQQRRSGAAHANKERRRGGDCVAVGSRLRCRRSRHPLVRSLKRARPRARAPRACASVPVRARARARCALPLACVLLCASGPACVQACVRVRVRPCERAPVRARVSAHRLRAPVRSRSHTGLTRAHAPRARRPSPPARPAVAARAGGIVRGVRPAPRPGRRSVPRVPIGPTRNPTRRRRSRRRRAPPPACAATPRAAATRTPHAARRTPHAQAARTAARKSRPVPHSSARPARPPSPV